MAKKYVPCNNKQEAIAARGANLLWIDMFEDGRYELCKGIDVEWLQTAYRNNVYYILTDDDE